MELISKVIGAEPDHFNSYFSEAFKLFEAIPVLNSITGGDKKIQDGPAKTPAF